MEALANIIERVKGLPDDSIADAFFDWAIARSYRTDPCDRASAERAWEDLVQVSGIGSMVKPGVRWLISPPADLKVEYWISTECDRSWSTYYAAAPALGIDDERELAQSISALLDEIHLVIVTEDGEVVMVERPEIYTVDTNGLPHSFGGRPDLLYRDGLCTYHWHGIRLPRAAIERPESITIQQISEEKNQERRRALIALYGEGRWLIDTGAKPIDVDPEYGTLYQLENSDLILMVSDGVTQLDGTNPKYTLRVNRECRPMIENPVTHAITYGAPQAATARNAAASTYGLRGEEYVVELRT